MTTAMKPHWQDAVDLHAHAPPFKRNPSAWSQRVPICVLAGIGAMIAGYLSMYQMGLIDSVWDPIFGEGSEKVLTSDTAKTMDRWLHIPDALFGAWGYLSEAVLGLVGSTRRWQHRPWMVILFGIDVIPLGGVGAILVLMQGFVVGSFCTLCILSAMISLTLIFFAYDEAWASMTYLWRVWKHHRSVKLVWNTFCGIASEEAEAVALKPS